MHIKQLTEWIHLNIMDMASHIRFECMDSSNRVMFDVPHGSIISMDEEAAGSNEARNYRHWIKSAEDTYTLCLELGIGDENHGDLRGCSWKEGNEEGQDEEVIESYFHYQR